MHYSFFQSKPQSTHTHRGFLAGMNKRIGQRKRISISSLTNELALLAILFKFVDPHRGHFLLLNIVSFLVICCRFHLRTNSAVIGIVEVIAKTLWIPDPEITATMITYPVNHYDKRRRSFTLTLTIFGVAD